MIIVFSQENCSFLKFKTIILDVNFLILAVGADAVQLTVGFFGKHEAGSRVQKGQSHGNAAAVGAGVGVPVSAFQKYHFNGSCIFFHRPSSTFRFYLLPTLSVLVSSGNRQR